MDKGIHRKQIPSLPAKVNKYFSENKGAELQNRQSDKVRNGTLPSFYVLRACALIQNYLLSGKLYYSAMMSNGKGIKRNHANLLGY